MIKRIDHIGIAVRSLDEQVKFYTEVLGLRCTGIEEIADQKVRVAIFPVGEIRIELLEPLSDDSPVIGSGRESPAIGARAGAAN